VEWWKSFWNEHGEFLVYTLIALSLGAALAYFEPTKEAGLGLIIIVAGAVGNEIKNTRKDGST
jgi:lipoprotein signal peptidase